MRPVRLRRTEDRHHECRLAGTVGTDQRHDLTLVHRQVDALEGANIAVIGLDLFDGEKRLLFLHGFSLHHSPPFLGLAGAFVGAFAEAFVGALALLEAPVLAAPLLAAFTGAVL